MAMKLPGKRPGPLEKDVLAACMEWLRLSGWLCWRNNTGVRPWTDARGKRRIMRFGAIGSGDAFAIRGGVFLSLETKRPGAVPTAAQLAWMEDVKRHGGIALCADSLQSLIDQLEALE